MIITVTLTNSTNLHRLDGVGFSSLCICETQKNSTPAVRFHDELNRDTADRMHILAGCLVLADHNDRKPPGYPVSGTRGV